jgi:hypothetical protein
MVSNEFFGHSCNFFSHDHYLLASVVSPVTDLPTGPSLVWSMAVVEKIFGLFFSVDRARFNRPDATQGG